MITLLQNWEWLRIAPPDLHDWNRFIKPKELRAILSRHGLEPRDTIGLSPNMNPVENLKRLFAIRRFKRGEISYTELGQYMMFESSRFMFINYMGYALKP
jgi:2-polyprenyl-6-hydroxyphenyl methylase/3-demethylubiquinone-9 3-methyltransferase